MQFISQFFSHISITQQSHVLVVIILDSTEYFHNWKNSVEYIYLRCAVNTELLGIF